MIDRTRVQLVCIVLLSTTVLACATKTISHVLADPSTNTARTANAWPRWLSRNQS